MAKSSSMIKVAGLSLLGFCAASYVADKLTSTEAAQLAGYCGAFAGALVGRARAKRQSDSETVGTDAAQAVPVVEDSTTEPSSPEMAQEVTHNDGA